MKFRKLGFVFAVVTSLAISGTWHGAAQAQSYGTKNCSTGQKDILRPAVNEAYRLLQLKHTDAQFIRWFGDTRGNPALWKQIHDMVAWVNTYAVHSLTLLGAIAIAPMVTFDCAGGRNSIAAHVTGAGATVIYLDNPFWGLPDKPSIQHVSKASTIIHELTHLAGTLDGNPSDFGRPADLFNFALWLAANTDFAVWNANNHEHYYLNL